MEPITFDELLEGIGPGWANGIIYNIRLRNYDNKQKIAFSQVWLTIKEKLKGFIPINDREKFARVLFSFCESVRMADNYFDADTDAVQDLYILASDGGWLRDYINLAKDVTELCPMVFFSGIDEVVDEDCDLEDLFSFISALFYIYDVLPAMETVFNSFK